jgi:predicted glycogen debranching enzyme
MTVAGMENTPSNEFLDFRYIHDLEYVEANGLGGYAAGTFSGAHSRKYHGLLVASLKPPVQRVVVVSKIDETLRLGDEEFQLGCNQFPGALHPFGVQYLSSFKRDLFPEWVFQVRGVTIRKTLAAIYGENTTVVLYEVLEAPGKFTMELQPFYASRDIHHLTKANRYIGEHYIFDKGVFQTMNYQRCPEFFISIPKSTFIEDRVWHYNFEHHQEYLRGMDFREDLFSHGRFSVTLRKGNRLGVIVSLDNPSGKDAVKLLREERKRRLSVTRDFEYHPSLRRLALAADQFIVKRGDLNTIIAGYPWFTDWGRDTMIALPGVCLATGRFRDAKRILQKFSEYISEGMIPNRFPDSGQNPEYNTIDATLWFVNAIFKYYEYSKDKLFIKAMLPALREIIDWHYKGTRYNIKVDPADELLAGGEHGVQLTWMDAKIGDWVITPRRGKPVEINALWYNALCVVAYFHRQLNYHDEAQVYAERASRVGHSFNDLFWNNTNGSLYDYIDGDYRCDDIRPNQIYALSLPFPVLQQDRALAVIEIVQNQLLTPRGLRSLSPLHADYRGRYEGNPFERDSMYHQGPAWSHLTGAYIDALFYALGDDAPELARAILDMMFQTLDEAGLGTISEIFDGDAPFAPRGCVAQAWSVGEILRVSFEYKLWERSRDTGQTETMETIRTAHA